MSTPNIPSPNGSPYTPPLSVTTSCSHIVSTTTTTWTTMTTVPSLALLPPPISPRTLARIPPETFELIDEIRIHTARLTHPREIVLACDRAGLNVTGPLEQLQDRLARYRIKSQFSHLSVPWDPETDERGDSLPLSLSVALSDPLTMGILRDQTDLPRSRPSFHARRSSPPPPPCRTRTPSPSRPLPSGTPSAAREVLRLQEGALRPLDDGGEPPLETYAHPPLIPLPGRPSEPTVSFHSHHSSPVTPPGPVPIQLNPRPSPPSP